MAARALRAIGGHGLRYGTGAVLCALVSNAVLIAADRVGWPLLAGVVLSWLGGGLVGYVWHARVTYRARLTPLAAMRFLGGSSLGIPLAWAVLALLSQGLGWPMVLAAPTATVVLSGYHALNAFVAIRWPRFGLQGHRTHST